jgi:hypothetical protein
MADTIYVKAEITGNTVNSLDGINGSLLADKDLAIVCYGNKVYLYQNNANATNTESSPTIIVPDTNPGSNRWFLQMNNTVTY